MVNYISNTSNGRIDLVKICSHPLANQTKSFSQLSDWVLTSEECAFRYILDSNPMVYDNRAAFIEKSGRVRIPNIDKEEWIYFHKTDLRGMSLDSLTLCDEKLSELGWL